MPLNPIALANDLRPIWQNWSTLAFQNMQVVQFPNNIPQSRMQNIIASSFAETFSSISAQLVGELNKTLLSGIVNTPNGSSPTRPLSISSVALKFKRVLNTSAKKALLDASKLSFSRDLPQDRMQELVAENFGETFSDVGEEFGEELKSALDSVGYRALVATTIGNQFKPIFKQWAKTAFKASNQLKFSEDTSPPQAQNLVSQTFGVTFSGITPQFAQAYVSVLLSSPVQVSLGVGMMS